MPGEHPRHGFFMAFSSAFHLGNLKWLQTRGEQEFPPGLSVWSAWKDAREPSMPFGPPQRAGREDAVAGFFWHEYLPKGVTVDLYHIRRQKT